MMRTLGTLILLSAAAFAQTPTAVQNPAAPATVSVQPTTNTAKPSPNGAKASTTSVVPKTKAAGSVKATSVATQKPVSVKSKVTPKANPITAGTKSPSTATATKAVSVKAAAAKPASLGPKVKPVPAQVSAAKTTTAASGAVPAGKNAPIVGVLVKPAAVPVAKGASKLNSVSVKSTASTKPAVAHVATKPASVKAVTVKPVARVKTAGHPKIAGTAAGPKVAPSVQESKPAAGNRPASTEFHTAGRRDPFLSPVVAMGAMGSGCSAGKRCLTIDQIALKGVVKAESGMIAVVTNSLDKAYFLRENDPVFNGYVVKITGDSIIFKETFHDRLGKALTRDVTKSITRPVA
jgi:Tfp pilus assembly protein PilP